MKRGYIPSFCTACYRAGRTGDRFMELCKTKQIHNCCHPNALLTLQEYLCDYASPETRAIGEKLIADEIKTLPEKTAVLTEKWLASIKNNTGRDFRF